MISSCFFLNIGIGAQVISVSKDSGQKKKSSKFNSGDCVFILDFHWGPPIAMCPVGLSENGSNGTRCVLYTNKFSKL